MNPQENQPGSPQQQVVERLRTAVNVLVTVSNNPSVDQLSAAIGFTLLLNKLGKHATTVFSGAVPSTIEFLKPDETIEKNTDSLRDFIVSLDKSKADKLRYKVEQNVVKIFITPYHSSITEKDLEFSQGDFNVDAVLALGVSAREQLDQAITAHGRILHDATVITVSAGNKASSLGAINWHDAGAASLCEMLVGIGDALQPGLLDTQAATAFLTGIVAETDRFSNQKTTPKIMSLAAQLMAAGANQQLIATQLEAATEVPLKAGKDLAAPEGQDGALTIEHGKAPQELPKDTPAIEPQPIVDPANEIAIDEHGIMSPAEPRQTMPRHRLIEPLKEEKKPEPTEAGEEHPFTANMNQDDESEGSSDPLTQPKVEDKVTLSHDSAEADKPDEATPPPAQPFIPAPDVTLPPVVPDAAPIPPALDDNTLRDIEKTFDSRHIAQDPNSTLNEIEEVVDSSHLTEPETSELVMTPPAGQVDVARDAVSDAISAAPYDPTRPQPLQALNASPLSFSNAPAPAAPANDPVLAGLGLTDNPAPQGLTLPSVSPAPVAQTDMSQHGIDPTGQAPPPVPPPLMPMQ